MICSCIMVFNIYCVVFFFVLCRDRHGRDRMVVGFTTYAIRARCTTLCDKACQWLSTGWWFSPGPPVSSTNKTDRHDITEILLKVALNTINQIQTNQSSCLPYVASFSGLFILIAPSVFSNLYLIYNHIKAYSRFSNRS